MRTQVMMALVGAAAAKTTATDTCGTDGTGCTYAICTSTAGKAWKKTGADAKGYAACVTDCSADPSKTQCWNPDTAEDNCQYGDGKKCTFKMCKSHDSEWAALKTSAPEWEATPTGADTTTAEKAAHKAAKDKQTAFHNWWWSQHCNKYAQQKRRLEKIVRVQQWNHLNSSDESSLSSAKSALAKRETSLSAAKTAYKAAVAATASTKKKYSTAKATTAAKLTAQIAANDKKCGTKTAPTPTKAELDVVACKTAHSAYKKAVSAEKTAKNKWSADKKTEATKLTAQTKATTAHTDAQTKVTHWTDRTTQNSDFKAKWANYSSWADNSLKWTEADQDAVSDNEYGLNNAAYHPVKSDATDLQAANNDWVTTQTHAQTTNVKGKDCKAGAKSTDKWVSTAKTPTAAETTDCGTYGKLYSQATSRLATAKGWVSANKKITTNDWNSDTADATNAKVHKLWSLNTIVNSDTKADAQKVQKAIVAQHTAAVSAAKKTASALKKVSADKTSKVSADKKKWTVANAANEAANAKVTVLAGWVSQGKAYIAADTTVADNTYQLAWAKAQEKLDTAANTKAADAWTAAQKAGKSCHTSADKKTSACKKLSKSASTAKKNLSTIKATVASIEKKIKAEKAAAAKKNNSTTKSTKKNKHTKANSTTHTTAATKSAAKKALADLKTADTNAATALAKNKKAQSTDKCTVAANKTKAPCDALIAAEPALQKEATAAADAYNHAEKAYEKKYGSSGTVGIIIGCIAGALVVGGGAAWYIRHRKNEAAFDDVYSAMVDNEM